MITNPNVLVSIDGGVASVNVNRNNLVAEVRDYDVGRTAENHPHLWTDENGRCCARQYVTGDEDESIAARSGNDLGRFVADLKDIADVKAKVNFSPHQDGLHVLQVDDVDFYFNANGTGYDGWGRAMSPSSLR